MHFFKGKIEPEYHGEKLGEHSKVQTWIQMFTEEIVLGQTVSGKLHFQSPTPKELYRVLLIVEGISKAFDGVIPFPCELTFTSVILTSWYEDLWFSSKGKLFQSGEYTWVIFWFFFFKFKKINSN